MNNWKNTFYEKKDYNTYDYYHKYMRVNDRIDNELYITFFTENLIEAKKVHVMEDDLSYGWVLQEKTLQKLCVGDIIVDEDGEYKKVLGVINQNCYQMSNGRESTHCSSTFSVKELEDEGYEPYIEDTEEPEVEELTMEEVCKEIGRNIKIKK